MHQELHLVISVGDSGWIGELAQLGNRSSRIALVTLVRGAEEHKSRLDLDKRVFIDSLPTDVSVEAGRRLAEQVVHQLPAQPVLKHHESLSDEMVVAEDEAAYGMVTHTTLDVPVELVPTVRELIAKHHSK